MSWDLNGYIHPDVQPHVKEIKSTVEHYHILLKNNRRVSVPREQFKRASREKMLELFDAINNQIFIQANSNVHPFKREI